MKRTSKSRIENEDLRVTKQINKIGFRCLLQSKQGFCTPSELFVWSKVLESNLANLAKKPESERMRELKEGEINQSEKTNVLDEQKAASGSANQLIVDTDEFLEVLWYQVEDAAFLLEGKAKTKETHENQT